MPVLQQLYVLIRGSDDASFARPSLVEAILPSSLVELHYHVSFVILLPMDIQNYANSNASARFPMKISNQSVCTIPWKWGFLGPSFPAGDYEPDHQRTINMIWTWKDTFIDEENMPTLNPWHHVRVVHSNVKLPSLGVFRCLRRLVTSDSSVVHATMPPRLGSLKLTGMDSDQQTFQQFCCCMLM